MEEPIVEETEPQQEEPPHATVPRREHIERCGGIQKLLHRDLVHLAGPLLFGLTNADPNTL